MRIAIATVAFAILFLLLAEFARHQVISAINRQAIGGLAESMLARAEIATDYAVIKLGELYQDGDVTCDAASMAALDRAVFDSGSIKDILTSVDGVTCSVATESDALTRNHLAPRAGAPARNPKIVLNPVGMADKPAMAVTWNFSETAKAAALVNTDSLVFDILPPEFRERGKVSLRLSNGAPIGAFAGPGLKETGITEIFEAVSSRYPFTARIEVPATLAGELNMERNGLRLSIATVLAIFFGFLVARGVVPPVNSAAAIRRALARNEIVPYFQPIYNVETGEMSGFEVLARWPRPDGQLVGPSTFVPVIEENGWSRDLLELMVAKTARSMRDLLAQSPQLKFAFNASPVQINDPGFADWISQVAKRHGLDPKRVVIEITEREQIGDVDRARRSVEALRLRGIVVAIDDAGTGHNGLASIQGLGAAVLKIDKLFVDRIVDDPRARALVQMLVQVGREYGMTIVAEGVEKGTQLAALGSLGVDEVQGFFLCRPLDATQAMTEYARHQAVMLSGRIGGTNRAARDAEAKAKPETIPVQAQIGLS